jgi:hypothetical protein
MYPAIELCFFCFLLFNISAFAILFYGGPSRLCSRDSAR